MPCGQPRLQKPETSVKASLGRRIRRACWLATAPEVIVMMLRCALSAGSPAATIRLAISWVKKNVPRRVTFITRSKVSWVASRRSRPRVLGKTPAALTRQSIRPKAAKILAPSPGRPGTSGMSAVIKTARRPVASILAGVARHRLEINDNDVVASSAVRSHSALYPPAL